MLIPEHIKIFLALNPVDMRKSINGLAIIVAEQFQQSPTSGDLYLFHNKRGDKLKAIYWERDCFTLWYRRLEKGKFKFPPVKEGQIEISEEQFNWLLDSFDFAKMTPTVSQELTQFY